MLRTFYFRSGDFKTAHAYARRCKSAADTIQDFAASAQARSILGRSLHLAGELDHAHTELDASLADWARAGRTTIYLSHELHFPSEVTMARNLWLRGYPDQAAERARSVIESAVRTDRAAALVVALGWAVSVFLWNGEWDQAQEHVDALIYQAETHSLGPFVAAGQARRGELAIPCGSAEQGIDDMRASLATIHSIGYEVLTTEFNISLVRGLAAIGRAVEAHELLDLTIQGVEINGDALYMPELLRVKGNLLLGNSQLSHQAQACLWRSIETSRRQGARGWELRTATDLARAMASDHNFDGARTLLQPVLGAYVEGLDSTDIREARQLLEKMPV